LQAWQHSFPSNDFLLVFLEYLKSEVSLAKGAGQYVKKISFHEKGDIILIIINLWMERRQMIAIVSGQDRKE